MTSSSSASGSGTSGSLSSQSAPSSMDSGATLPTQDLNIDDVDGNWSEDDESIWGKLYPITMGKGFHLLDLRKENYVFGRDTESDVYYTPADFARNVHFQGLSKKHFELIKESSDTGEHIVYIKDLSSNGTFLNGELIGKGNKHVMQNNSEIQLARAENRAYIFIDLKTTKEEHEMFPQEVKAKYTLSKVLGRGACGEVRLAFGKGKECDKFAVKIITKRTFSSNPANVSRDSVEEAEILKKLNHPCIVKILDVFDTTETLFIVLELIEGGDLYDRVSTNKRLDEDETKLIFYQILVAVQYLHDNGFTHRDLKPENVLLCSSERETLIKITDFGVSKFVGEQSFMKTLCGTQSYLAPEVVQSIEPRQYKKQCDCWSLGVILFVCLGGYPPFGNHPNRSLEEQILQGAFTFPGRIWKNVSSEAKDLISKFLTVDPQMRISIKDARQHPWMKNKEIIDKAEKLMSEPTKNVNNNQMLPPIQNMNTTKRKDHSDDDSPMKRQKSTE